MIGCDCGVCRSPDPRNRRHRSSVLLTLGRHQVLVDATAELRIQALTFDLRRIDAVLLTHAHADHISGLDDLRAFSNRQPRPIPIYCASETSTSVRRQYEYVFNGIAYPGKPNLELQVIDGPFTLFGHEVIPLTVPHGEHFSVTAFRIGGLGYVTDASAVPAEARAYLRDLDVLVLNALRVRPHPAHLSLAEAVAVVEDLRPRRALFTHIAHDLDHEAVNAHLPSSMELAHDGLALDIPC